MDKIPSLLLMDVDLSVTPAFEIIYLADARDLIVPLAPLLIEEWEPYYGRQGPGDAEGDLNDCCNIDTIPLALVAIDEDREVLGTAALKARSIETHRHLTPWLTAMFVPERHRGHGIRVALVDAIEKDAVRLGYKRLYVNARGISGTMLENGWALLEDAEAEHGPIEVYVKDLVRVG